MKIISPAKLVEEIVDLYKDIAQQSGIELVSSISKSVKDAPFDPDGMQTCLTNLVSNAISYSSENGRVIIRIEETEKIVTIMVQDSGIGID